MNYTYHALVPWCSILLCIVATIMTSSFLATIVSTIPKRASASPETPDITRPASIAIATMPLVSKPAGMAENYLYSTAELTRDDDDDMDAFRKNIVRF